MFFLLMFFDPEIIKRERKSRETEIQNNLKVKTIMLYYSYSKKEYHCVKFFTLALVWGSAH